MFASNLSNSANFRWFVVAAAALVLGIAMGMLVNGFSSFVRPIEAQFGWNRADVAMVNSIGLVGIAIGGIAIGIIADRVAVRAICVIGAITLSIALLLASQADELWQFYSIFFVAGFIGGGALFAPVIALVGNWFVKGAGLAIGIVSAGQALGQGLVPFIAAYLIQFLGWQNAFVVLGLGAACTLIPLSFLLRQPPQIAVAQTAESGEVTLSPYFTIPALCVAVFGCCTCMAVPLMHLVPLVQDVCGVGAEAGGPLLAMLISAIAGRIFIGRLSDILGPIAAWMMATAWQTTLVLGFVMIDTLEGFWLFAPLYGFGYGGVMTGVLVTVRALSPPAHRASATAIVLAFGWLGHAFGAWQGGFFYDLTGDYLVSYANAAFSGAVNLAIVGVVWIAIRRIRFSQTPSAA